jgi:hypothetical protein
MWLAGSDDVYLRAAEAAQIRPGIESVSCSQSPNDMFPDAAGALALILRKSTCNSQHPATSWSSGRIEEVRHGAVPEPAAVRELLETTGPGPAGLQRPARWRGHRSCRSDCHHRTGASPLRENQDRGSAGALCHSGLFISCVPTG